MRSLFAVLAINGNRHADGGATAGGFNLKPTANKSDSLVHTGDADAHLKRGAGGPCELPTGGSFTLIAEEIQFFSDLGAWTYLSGLQTHPYRDVSTLMSQRRKMAGAGGVGIRSPTDLRNLRILLDRQPLFLAM
jgi:hypothetical protein